VLQKTGVAELGLVQQMASTLVNAGQLASLMTVQAGLLPLLPVMTPVAKAATFRRLALLW
jgi:hypothetical protein